MPISLSAKKSNRKASKNRKANVIWKNRYKEIVKKFLLAPSKESLQEVYSMVDKLSKHFIFHKNKASRLKSKFSRKLKSLAKNVKPATTPKKIEVKKIVKKTIVKKTVAKKVKKVAKKVTSKTVKATKKSVK
jgi:ribosomal protein S20